MFKKQIAERAVYLVIFKLKFKNFKGFSSKAASELMLKIEKGSIFTAVILQKYRK